MKEINGEISRQCGDINLVSAMMACGITLNPRKPCTVIESEDGHTYTSFIYLPVGVDGRTLSDHLIAHWVGKIKLPDDDGFAQVCEFIRARPKGVQRSADLMDFAMKYLADRAEPVFGVRQFDDIPDFVAKAPNGRAQFILAYVWNRDICYQLHKRAGRSVHMGDMSKTGGRCAIIGHNLPQWQKRELVSRFLG